jgi:hypothetical protein
MSTGNPKNQHPFAKLFRTLFITTMISSLTVNCSYQNKEWTLEVTYKAALKQLVEQFKLKNLSP